MRGGVRSQRAAAGQRPREGPRGVSHPVPDDLPQSLVEALPESSRETGVEDVKDTGERRLYVRTWQTKNQGGHDGGPLL